MKTFEVTFVETGSSDEHKCSLTGDYNYFDVVKFFGLNDRSQVSWYDIKEI